MAVNKSVLLLISDLDNTLYDWVSFFVPSFYAMVNAAVKELGTDREQLLDDLKSVHQNAGSSEHPFALLETKTVRLRFPYATEEQKKRLLACAFKAFNDERKARLRLYPTVAETLRRVREQGTRVVAYTEAAIYNVVHRLELLGTMPDIDLIYAGKGKGSLGSVLGQPAPRLMPMEKVRLLPFEHYKPNPGALLDICDEQKIAPDRAIYVGDSLVRDVGMANRAGVTSVWARYGTKVDHDFWQQLVRVTHWTDADVQNEKRLRDEFKAIQPDVTIDSFGALLTHFRFGSSIHATG